MHLPRTARSALALALASVLAVLAGPGPTVSAHVPAGPTTSARPDIIVFLTDDMRLDELARLPHVRHWVAGLYHYDTGWTAGVNGVRVTYPPGVYREHQIRRDLLGRVRAWQPATRPYFAMVAHPAPHNIRVNGVDRSPVPSMRYRGTVDPRSLPAPPGTEETDRSDKPFWIDDHPRVIGFMRC